MFSIRLPFDPREVFGKARPPVKVTINGHTYRSTVANMGGGPFIPFRQSNRDAAGVSQPGPVEVSVELDAEKREVTPPEDLLAALQANAAAWTGWQRLSFTHQREHVEAIEGAKRPETRDKRIKLAVEMATTRADKPAR